MSESLVAKLDRYFSLANDQYSDLSEDASESERQSYNSQLNDIVNKSTEVPPDSIQLEDIRKAEDTCKNTSASSAQECVHCQMVQLHTYVCRRIDIISAAFTIINGIVSSDLPKHPEGVNEEVRKHYEESK